MSFRVTVRHAGFTSNGSYLMERRYARRSTSCRTVMTWLKSPMGESTLLRLVRTSSLMLELISCDGDMIAVAR